MHRFANPVRFQRITDASLPWFGGAALALTLLGLYLPILLSGSAGLTWIGPCSSRT